MEVDVSHDRLPLKADEPVAGLLHTMERRVQGIGAGMSFKKSFQKLHPQLVDAALAPVKGNADVTDVWVLGLYEDRVSSATAVYKVAGKYVALSHMEKELAAFDAERVMDDVNDAWDEMQEGEDREKLPHSVIVHHDVAKQETEVEVSHDRLPLKADEPVAGLLHTMERRVQG